MATYDAQLGDVGTAIIVVIKDGSTILNVSDATEKEITLESPAGIVTDYDAVLHTDGLDGKIKYVTATANDLNEVGSWRIQGRVKFADGNWHTSIGKFKVGPNL